MSLMHTEPVCICRAIDFARSMSFDHTLPDNPYSESLASRIASSSVENVTIGSTGPNVSSRMMDMSCVTPVMTVGWKKIPGRSVATEPPVRTVAPSAMAAST